MKFDEGRHENCHLNLKFKAKKGPFGGPGSSDEFLIGNIIIFEPVFRSNSRLGIETGPKSLRGRESGFAL
jgi:hypothetical protein